MLSPLLRVLRDILLLALLIVLANLGQSWVQRQLGSVLRWTVSLPMRGWSEAEAALGEWAEHYIFLQDADTENRVLERENERLRLENMRLSVLAEENERLRRLLQFSLRQHMEIHPARIVSPGLSSNYRAVFAVPLGDREVAEGSAVVTDQGVVGRLLGVSGGFWEILLATDPNCRIDVLIQPGRIRGVAIGSLDRIEIHFVRSSETIEIGRSVVTSGRAGIYPAGLAIGTIDRVQSVPGELFYEVGVVPAVDFDRLEEVLALTTEYAP